MNQDLNIIPQLKGELTLPLIIDGVGIQDIIFNPDSSVTFVLTDGSSYTSPELEGEQGPEGEQGVPGISAYEQAVQGGYTGTEEQFNTDLAEFKDRSDEAVEAVQNSQEQALKSEGFALGTQNDEPVSSSSPYYQNNAKYYSELAAQHAEQAGYVIFDIDDSTGEMIVTVSDSIETDITFSINENTGELEVTVA